MSGLVGSITKISKEFNGDFPMNDTIKGIKAAGSLYNKIQEAELAKEVEESIVPDEPSVDSQALAQEIQAEMDER